MGLQIRLTPSLHAFNVFKLIQNSKKMADNDVDVNEELLDYEDEPETETTEAPKAEDAAKNGKVKGNYVSIHSSGFRDFLLKPEVLRSIGDCGFEHPSKFSTNVFPRLCWAWTCCARPSLVWAGPLCSCWPPCSRSSPWTVRSPSWSCATPGSSPSRSARSTRDSQSLCLPSRVECFLVVWPFPKMSRF